MIFTEFCALFWSKWYWKRNFGRTPPGLIGSGSGIGVGSYYLGPATEWNVAHDPASVAYTRKDFFLATGTTTAKPNRSPTTSARPSGVRL